MNATEQARQAYAPAQSPFRTGRSAELQVFSQVTSRLRAAAQESDRNFAGLAKALHENRQLWTRIAADVAETDNALPQELRAQIFYLSEFTVHQSRKILRGEASADSLIDVNTAVMRGLSGHGRAGVA